MSTNNQLRVAYGLSQPLINVLESIQSNRSPLTTDKAPISTIWVNKLTNSAFILTSVVNNIANWEAFGTGMGTESFLTDAGTATPAGGVITVHGGSNINTSGAASTVTVNLDDTVSISGSLTAGTTAGFITSQTGDITATAGNFVLPTTNIGGTEGVIQIGGNPFINNAVDATNTFMGTTAGDTLLTSGGIANSNTGIGNDSMFTFGAGTSNTALGAGTLLFSASGDENTAIGAASLANVVTGGLNTALGINSGFNYNGAESSNLVLVSEGVVGESNTMRIGAPGNNPGQQNRCFIAGITGVTVTGAAVLCSTAGQLGTISSSRKFKENIADISSKSKDILSLRPVMFNYIKDDSVLNHYGLIAEEVQEIFPDLVLYDEYKEPTSVAYHELPVLLLNELKNSNSRISVLEKMLTDILQKLG